MRTNRLLFILVGVLLLSGCRKMGEFKIKNSSEFTIPGNSAIGSVVPSPMDVTSSSSFEFKNNGTEAKYIKEIRLDQLTLTITNPSGKTFSFLNSIHMYIYTDDLPEVEIAYLDNIPATVGGSIDLITTGAVLDEYLKRDRYKLKVKTVTDELFTQDITIRSDLTFRVKAKIL